MLAGITLVAAMTVAPLASAAPPAQLRSAEQPQCKSRAVIGLRGSAEPRTGAFDMGPRVAPYASVAAQHLSPEHTEYISLDYPASDLGPDWLDSVETGINMLTEMIRDMRSRCPEMSFGLIGYSQGAFVVSRVIVDSLQPVERAWIKSVLLLSDPSSAGPTYYARALTTEGEPARPGLGGLLSRTPLPDDIQNRTIDFCLKGDVVCDAAETIPWPNPADPESVTRFIETLRRFATGPHLTYGTCCTRIDLPTMLAEHFAMWLGGNCRVTTGFNEAPVPIPDSPTQPPGPPADSLVVLRHCPANASPLSRVGVDITHTFCGDLSIDLIRSPADTDNINRSGPDDTVFTIKRPDETDGRECDGVQWYPFNGFGTTTEGLWTLVIRDHARLDTGTLNGWQLDAW